MLCIDNPLRNYAVELDQICMGVNSTEWKYLEQAPEFFYIRITEKIGNTSFVVFTTDDIMKEWTPYEMVDIDYICIPYKKFIRITADNNCNCPFDKILISVGTPPKQRQQGDSSLTKIFH